MTCAEDAITRWFAEQSRLDPQRFPIGIGDDMAQINLSGGASVLITTDMLLDGVHFDLADCTLAQAARKAMAVSLSDCAAMATIPLGAVVAVALPRGWGHEELKEIHAGIRAAGDPFNCPLIGGDITVWPRGTGGASAERGDGVPPLRVEGVLTSKHPAVEGYRLAITVTMLSAPGARPPVRRSTAQPNDIICVTGSLGGAYPRGTSILPMHKKPVAEGDCTNAIRNTNDCLASGFKHLEFTPRVNEALAITELVPLNAMIDLSDGLSSDLTRICEQSKVGAVIESGQLPLSDEARRSPDPVASALNDGEDFELLFTLTCESYAKLAAAWAGPTPINRIGRITAAPGIILQSPDGTVAPVTAAGYDHLSPGF